MTSKNELLEELKDKLSISENETQKLLSEIIIVNPELDWKDLVRINPITYEAETIKLKNLTINLKKAMIDSTEMGLAIFGVVTHPWLIPLAAIIAIDKLWAHIKIDIHPMLAIVLQALWENSENKKVIESYEEALIHVNKKLVSLNKPQISSENLQDLLDKLELLKIIEQKGNCIFLRETVTFNSKF